MKEFTIPPTTLVTFLAATLLQVTLIYQLIVIAGIMGGLLAKDLRTAVISGLLGFLLSWGFYFAILSTFGPEFAAALSMFSIFLGIGLLLISVLGIASASIGYCVAKIAGELKEEGRKRR